MNGNKVLKNTIKCRTCLNGCKQLKSLRNGIIIRKHQKKSYGQLLKEVTNINIMDNKYREMPQFICICCLRKLKLAHAFVQQAQKAHNKLWSMQKRVEAENGMESLEKTQINMKSSLEIVDVDIDKLLEENLENAIPFETVTKDDFDILDDDDTYTTDLDTTQIDIINLQNTNVNVSNKQYFCEHCSAAYTTKYRLTNHLRKVHFIEPYTKEKTLSPIDTKPQSAIKYSCAHCDSHYKTQLRLVSHLNDKHNIVENFEDKQFEVEDQNEMDSMDDTSRTNNNCSSAEINNSQVEETITPERYCKKCSASYTRKCILNRHIREKHQSSCTKTETSIKIMDPPISFTGYRCTKCSLRFGTQLKLIQHFRQHVEEKSYNSDDSDQTTPKITESTSTQKEKPCVSSEEEENNGLKEKQTPALTDSNPPSLGDDKKKLFQCKVCVKSFDKSTQLSVHMRVHTFDRPFKCNECPKAYTKPWDLKIHQRNHTGEMPYSCGYCQMTFARTHSLKQHQKKCPEG